MMAEFVYALCAITSAGCAVLLLRSYMNSGTRLLLWSSICFVCLAVNNVLLFTDLVVVPTVDLSAWRTVTSVLAIALLVFGLTWDTE